MLRQQSDRQQCGSKVRMENDVGARDGSDDERQEIFRVSRYGFYDYPYGSKELLAQASLLSLSYHRYASSTSAAAQDER